MKNMIVVSEADLLLLLIKSHRVDTLVTEVETLKKSLKDIINALQKAHIDIVELLKGEDNGSTHQ